MTVASDAPGSGQRVAVGPIYIAGFVTALSAHAVAANLTAYAVARHNSLWSSAC